MEKVWMIVQQNGPRFDINSSALGALAAELLQHHLVQLRLERRARLRRQIVQLVRVCAARQSVAQRRRKFARAFVGGAPLSRSYISMKRSAWKCQSSTAVNSA